jgi:iron complex outermembrane receptor protein
MKFKRHILMTSAAAALAMSAMGTHAFAQAAASGAPAASPDSTTVVVTGIRKSLQSALKQKRNADRVEEVISAEDIGKFPDKNVADSLSRATGVNVVTGSANAGGFGENERISIRGTDPNLNLTLMDGHNMATGDWFVLDQANAGRSFNYSMLPSEVVGNIEVIKASSADLPEGGVGGTVDVHVRKPLDLPANTFSMSAQALYASRPNKVTPNLSGMWSWKNDGHTLGVLVGAFYEQRDFRRDGQEVLGYTDQANFAGSGKTVSVPSLIGSAFFQQQRTREGGNLVVQWKPSDTFEAELSGLYTYLKADNSNHNFMMWGSHLAADTPNAGYTTTTNPSDGKTYLTSATWTDAEEVAGPNGDNGAIVQDDIFRKAHSSSYDINLDATWRALPDLTVKGQVGFTGGMGETDDSAAWETYWTGVGASYQLGKITPVQYTGLPSDPTSAAYLNNKFSWSWGGKQTSPDRELYAKLDFDYELPAGSFFKDVLFGARTTDHYRAVLYYAYSWAGNGAYSGTSGVNLGTVVGGKTPSNYAENLPGIPNTYSFGTADNVYNYLDSHNGGRKYGFYGQASFGVREKTQAYYIMSKFGDDKWFGNVGVRAVHTDSTAIQYTVDPTGPIQSIFAAPNGYLEEDIKHSYWNVLPSLNVNYKASDDLVYRASVSKVMTRPPYAQLAGYFYLVDANYTGGSGGNPDLKPFSATQYNLSAEWYYAPEALLSVGLFDLQIENFIKNVSFTGFYTDQKNPQGHTFAMTGPVNGGSAKDTGIELNWQQPIGGGFGFIGNMTMSSAKTSSGGAVDGNSKLTYNLTGYYEQGPISTRLSYQFRSKFQSGEDRSTPMWQGDYATLDGTFDYQVNSHLTLTLDAQNLLDRKLTYFVGSPNIPRAYYDYGQTFYAGFRLKY